MTSQQNATFGKQNLVIKVIEELGLVPQFPDGAQRVAERQQEVEEAQAKVATAQEQVARLQSEIEQLEVQANAAREQDRKRRLAARLAGDAVTPARVDTSRADELREDKALLEEAIPGLVAEEKAARVAHALACQSLFHDLHAPVNAELQRRAAALGDLAAIVQALELGCLPAIRSKSLRPEKQSFQAQRGSHPPARAASDRTRVQNHEHGNPLNGHLLIQSIVPAVDLGEDWFLDLVDALRAEPRDAEAPAAESKTEPFRFSSGPGFRGGRLARTRDHVET